MGGTRPPRKLGVRTQPKRNDYSIRFLLTAQEQHQIYLIFFHGRHATSMKARSQDSPERKGLFYSLPLYRPGKHQICLISSMRHATSTKARSQDSTEKKGLFYSIPTYRPGKHQIYLIFFHGWHAISSKARRQDSIDRGVVWLLTRD